jgi:hypothetical protein
MKQLVLLSLLLAQPAWAEWVKVTDATLNGNDYIVFWDPTTLRKTPNGRRAWSMSSFESAIKSSDGLSYKSTRTLREYDCAGERVRGLQQTLYSGAMLTGETLLEISNPSSWSFTAPNTVAAFELALYCKAPLPK